MPCGCCKRKKERRKSDYSVEHAGKIENILVELLNTEKGYVKDLKVMVSTYMDPLRCELFFDNTNLMLFNCVTLDLVEIQERFENDLEKIIVQLLHLSADLNLSDIIYNVANVFIQAEQAFSIYIDYVQCLTKVQALLSKTDGDEEIRAFIAKVGEGKGKDEHGRNTGLDALIITPLQRMLRYPMVLERIEKNCDTGTVDQEQIAEAIKVVKGLSTKMNDSMATGGSGTEYEEMLKRYQILQYKHEMARK